MRAREPDSQGYVDRDGVKLCDEVLGDGRPTLPLPPAWTIIHARSWKAQVPYLARHFRVVTYDGPGNGRSDRALLVSLSMGAQWALWRTAHHPERVLGNVFIAPTGGELVVLEGAGHLPHARDPVRVNRLIREFAESLPAGGPA